MVEKKQSMIIKNKKMPSRKSSNNYNSKKRLMEKINLIYILGTSFSGSTLLSLILGSQHGVLNVGEIWALENDYYHNRRCSCGKNVNKCDYWESIIKSYKEYIINNKLKCFFRFNNHNQKSDLLFNGLALHHRIAHNISTNPEFIFGKQNIYRYCNKNYFFLRYLLDFFDNKFGYVVDSSKSGDRLIALHSSNLFNIYVVFLTRNGESIIGKKIYNDRKQYLNISGIDTIKETIMWELEVRRFLKAIKKLNIKSCYRTSYELFSGRPEQVVSSICKQFNIKYNKFSFDKYSNEYFLKKHYHVFTGNKLISEINSDDEIRPVERWKGKLTSTDRLLFKIVGGGKINRLLSKGTTPTYHY